MASTQTPQKFVDGVLQKSTECLKYIHEHGYPWDETTCITAASSGPLDCLKYAHENGCPWDERVIQAAFNSSHPGCMSYALENGCPRNKNSHIDARDDTKNPVYVIGKSD